VQVLWEALKPGGIYVVEDISENYIEKPFLDKGTFTEFIKRAIDIVQCRHAPQPSLQNESRINCLIGPLSFKGNCNSRAI
jgi:hypothetical protein